MSNEKDLVIPPHKVKSREVTNADIDRVIADAQKMFEIAKGTCVALAHSQIESNDPLRFFVTNSNMIIINPVITRHTKTFMKSEEGCRTFKARAQIIVQRHYRIEFDFQVIDMHKLSKIQKEKTKGLNAFIVQHEIDHMNGKCIYDD